MFAGNFGKYASLSALTGITAVVSQTVFFNQSQLSGPLVHQFTRFSFICGNSELNKIAFQKSVLTCSYDSIAVTNRSVRNTSDIHGYFFTVSILDLKLYTGSDAQLTHWNVTFIVGKVEKYFFSLVLAVYFAKRILQPRNDTPIFLCDLNAAGLSIKLVKELYLAGTE
ncbi:hypothetical protein BpHYR1_047408 [Brachionus plicatilis]|uniref:Uncharacterized protein n=1 Tax=Brachionus plicatilis TaxID=10195 RepID=A0A3M7R9Z7_BRAPC|nr:hypothetical protein BpHYR1_047408 [Brachionus plicatilis]